MLDRVGVDGVSDRVAERNGAYLLYAIVSLFLVAAIASGDNDGKRRRAVTSDAPARINRPKHTK